MSTDIKEHRCAHCYVAQYGIKSNVPCKNEWWAIWDLVNGQSTPDLDDPDYWSEDFNRGWDRFKDLDLPEEYLA